MKYTFGVTISVEADDSSTAEVMIDNILSSIPDSDGFDFSINELRSER